MKTLLKILVCMCCMGGAISCTTTKSLSSHPNLDIITYQVFGMDCPGCHGGLEKNIRKIPGVVFVEANWKAQTVRIGVEPGKSITEAEISAAIKASNFTMGKEVD